MNATLYNELLELIHPYHGPRNLDPDSTPGVFRDLLKWLGYSRDKLSHPQLPTVDEVRREATERSSDVFEKWKRLHDLLLHHEAVIRKRWLKKTQEQRKRVLLSAWPGMATSHRPDYQAFRKDPTADRLFGLPRLIRPLQTTTPYRNEFLYPYINLEDLLKTNNLLLFLNSRGHNKPDEFAYFDSKTHHLGRSTGAIQPAYLHGYTMLLTDQTTPTTYGRLIKWGRELEGFMQMLYGTGFQPGEGLLVLEIQQTLLGFLVRCAESILHDLLPLQPQNSIPSALLTPASITQHNTEWPSVAVTVAEAPYRVPVHFDFPRIQSLVDAKFSEAEDHIWSLREDPGYFQDVLREWGEHRHEQLQDSNGKLHSTLGKPEFWDRVQREAIIHAYLRFTMWDLARKDLSEFANVRAQCGPRIRLGTDEPNAYEEALYKFWLAATDMRQQCLQTFHRGTPCSPPLRKYYYRKRNHDPHDSVFYDIQIKDVGMYNYFLWLLEHLTHEDQIEFCGFSELLDELERTTRSSSQGPGNSHHQPISSWVAACLSDLAVVSELERQLNCHQPRVVPCCDRDDDELKQRWMPSFWVEGILMEADLELKNAGTPLSKFNYPSAKARTATTVAQLQEAEKYLDIFWKQIDEYFMGRMEQSLHDSVGIVNPRELERTPKWVEPAPLTTSKESPAVAVSELFTTFTIDEQSSEPQDISPTKAKVKTRGIAIPSELEVHESSDIPLAPTPPPTIPVSKRAYKIFSSLFHDPTQDIPPGEIPWTDFLHALSSAGFSIEKQHGSAWLFSPPDSSQRPIIFHEPHPSSKIPIQIFRRYGRRLRLAYDWNADTFSIAR